MRTIILCSILMVSWLIYLCIFIYFDDLRSQAEHTSVIQEMICIDTKTMRLMAGIIKGCKFQDNCKKSQQDFKIYGED